MPRRDGSGSSVPPTTARSGSDGRSRPQLRTGLSTQVRALRAIVSFMRALALISGGVFVAAAAQQVNLPAPLVRHYDNLKGANSLTVDYTVRTLGEAAAPYKLVLSREGSFKLTTPSGFVLSDGKTVTTYRESTKTYTQEAYTPEWLSIFERRPDVLVWGAFLSKNPTAEVASAQLGAARAVQGNDTQEVRVAFTKPTVEGTLFVDRKLGVVRGWTTKTGEKETLVVAKTIELGKEPLAAEQFAFVAPAGSKKEEVASSTFAQVQAVLTANCMPCHSGGSPRAGINLTNYEGVSKIVIPGKVHDSLLVKSIHGAGARKMPPSGRSLTEEQMKLIHTWIADGAKP
ncbi:hypothetical protein EON82_01545 [bacterium]|nr:MAG: hypothetical protein EON82_01545 [bacterium]